jgi:hypothetical protein
MYRFIIGIFLLIQSILFSGCIMTLETWDESSSYEKISPYEDYIHSAAYKDHEHFYPVFFSDEYLYEISIGAQNKIDCNYFNNIFCKEYLQNLQENKKLFKIQIDEGHISDKFGGSSRYDSRRFKLSDERNITLMDHQEFPKPFKISGTVKEIKQKNQIFLLTKKVLLTPFTLVADFFIDIVGIPTLLILDVPMGGGRPN